MEVTYLLDEVLQAWLIGLVAGGGLSIIFILIGYVIGKLFGYIKNV